MKKELAQSLSIEITPAMATKMKSALKKKGWSLYKLQKMVSPSINYKTIVDMFSDEPTSNYRHRSKVEAVFTALEIEMK